MALLARKASPWLFTRFLDFEPPKHVARTSARAYTYPQCSRGCPCETSGKNEERPAGPSIYTPVSQTAMTKAERCPLHVLRCKVCRNWANARIAMCSTFVSKFPSLSSSTCAGRQGGAGRMLSLDGCQHREICWLVSPRRRRKPGISRTRSRRDK